MPVVSEAEPRRYRSGMRTRAAILDAVRQLLADNGLEGTTIAAICAKADISAGSFYNLFASKEAAVLTVVREAIEAIDPHGSDSSLDALLDAYVRFIVDEETLARVYLLMAVSGGLTDATLGSRFVNHHRQRIQLFCAAIVREAPDLTDDEVLDRAEALLAALNGYAFQWMLDPSFDLKGHAARLLEVHKLQR